MLRRRRPKSLPYNPDERQRKSERLGIKNQQNPGRKTAKGMLSIVYRIVRRKLAFVADNFGEQAGHLDSPGHLGGCQR
jgi:hypothetical protein